MSAANHTSFALGNRVLYIIATPIGNLEDITCRAKRLLKTASVIAAEDTRVAGRLLALLEIKTTAKLLSLRAHNEATAAAALFAAVGENEHAAYISDAGTPAVSDPGARLARLARAAGFAVSPVPGASALTALMAISGLTDGVPAASAAAGETATSRPPASDTPLGTHFFGFPPSATKKRREFFLSLRQLSGCAVLFESPHRIAATLTELVETFGGSTRAVLAREMTKLHEQIIDADLAQLVAASADGTIPARGEFSLLVELPGQPAAAVQAEKLFSLLTEALPPRRAAALTARATGADSAALYRMHLANQKDKNLPPNEEGAKQSAPKKGKAT